MGDGMSTPQRVVLAVALLLIALSGLYCPWTLTVSPIGTSGPTIYINKRAFLVLHPEQESQHTDPVSRAFEQQRLRFGSWPVKVRSFNDYFNVWQPVHLPGWHLIGARINHRALLIEWAVIAAAAGGIVLLLPRRKRRRKTA